MKVHLTENAKEIIDKYIDNGYLLLRYDTKGLGCGVNGMPTFRFSKEKLEEHMDIECLAYPAIISKQQATFFSDEVTISYVNGMFRLSSPEGILNPFISLQSVLD